MGVMHPKEGAVYWEGPVNVTLEVTLIGERAPGLQPVYMRTSPLLLEGIASVVPVSRPFAAPTLLTRLSVRKIENAQLPPERLRLEATHLFGLPHVGTLGGQER